jgi:hypothetical protein
MSYEIETMHPHSGEAIDEDNIVWNVIDKATGEIKVQNSALNLRTFYQKVAQGEIPGYSFVEKFGANPEIDTATTPEDVHDEGGTYTFSTTAIIDSLSSDDIGDTDISITVEGLDTNWDEVIQTISTDAVDGRTRVALTTNLIRVIRAYNDNGVELLGNIYIYENTALTLGKPTDVTKIRAKIRIAHGQTLMAIYSVPAGHTAYFVKGYVGLTAARAGTSSGMVWKLRLFEKVFRTQSELGLSSSGSSLWQYEYPFPLPVPEKSDVKITCEEVAANDTPVSGGFTIMLVEN